MAITQRYATFCLLNCLRPFIALCHLAGFSLDLAEPQRVDVGQIHFPTDGSVAISVSNLPKADHASDGNAQLAQFNFEGYLTKRGQLRKSWRRRYFVLRQGKLMYYKDRFSTTVPQGIIRFLATFSYVISIHVLRGWWSLT